MNKFKKQIYKSVSTITIISLVGSFVFGFPFNFKVNLTLKNATKKIIHTVEKVQADNASTTVTVENGAPYFVVDAAEVVVSASTSPVNIGNSITFSATADDYEENDYYLLICDSSASGATTTGVGAGVVPHCVNSGGSLDDSLELCASDSVVSTSTQATCTYNNVVDNGTEIQDWEAYVCDNHAVDPRCSASPNIGSGDSGSPMYLNHYPVFELISTTNNNNDPGSVFQITASTTDTDILGGADVVYLDVCSTNVWATSTGCAARTYCSASSTATSSAVNLICNFTASSTLPDTDYTYYGFVKDSHGFPSGDNSKSNTYTINNVSPTMGSVVLNNAGDISLMIKGAGGTLVNTYSANVTDNNGCTDLNGATSTIFLSSVGYGCSADDNNCYNIASTSCTLTDCSGDTDAIARYSCTTTLRFFTIPTSAGAHAAENWFSRITVFDEALSSSATSSARDVIATAALDVAENDIAYGAVKTTFNTGTDNATTTIINFGNTPINSEVSGKDMKDGSNSIPIGYQKHSLSTFDYNVAGATTSPSSTPSLIDVVIPRPQDMNDVTDEIYWGIGIPAGTPSGDYSGVNYFDVVEDASGNWN